MRADESPLENIEIDCLVLYLARYMAEAEVDQIEVSNIATIDDLLDREFARLP